MAQVVIAIINLFFAGYFIYYQISKEAKDKNEQSQIQTENLRLNWFKELIVQPNISIFFKFFDEVLHSCIALKSAGLTDEAKGQIVSDILTSQSFLRKQFIDLLHSVNKPLHDLFKITLDKMTDQITNEIFSTKDLTDNNVYEEVIINPVSEVKKLLVGRMVNYRGE